MTWSSPLSSRGESRGRWWPWRIVATVAGSDSGDGDEQLWQYEERRDGKSSRLLVIVQCLLFLVFKVPGSMQNRTDIPGV
jgi:hypothetical protein